MGRSEEEERKRGEGEEEEKEGRRGREYVKHKLCCEIKDQNAAEQAGSPMNQRWEESIMVITAAF